jgi:cytochrome c1
MSTPTLHEPKAESKTSFGTVVFCWLTVFVAFVEGMLLLIAEGKMSTYSGGVAAASGLAAIASAFTAPFVARSKTWLMAILLVLFGLAFINRNFLKYVLVTL